VAQLKQVCLVFLALILSKSGFSHIHDPAISAVDLSEFEYAPIKAPKGVKKISRRDMVSKSQIKKDKGKITSYAVYNENGSRRELLKFKAKKEKGYKFLYSHWDNDSLKEIIKFTLANQTLKHWEYNKQGKITKFSNYDLVTNTIAFSWTYMYNERGALIEAEIRRKDGVNHKHIAKLDSRDRIINVSISGEEGEEKAVNSFRYTKQGDLFKSRIQGYYDEKGQFKKIRTTETWTYEYNSDSNVVSLNHSFMTHLEYLHTYSYDKWGRLSQTTTIKEERMVGYVRHIYRNYYDDEGKIYMTRHYREKCPFYNPGFVRSVIDARDGSNEDIRQSEKEYDEQGYLIKISKFSEGEKTPSSITKFDREAY